MVETLLFYHPAVWWVSRRIREEREHCCDDPAIPVCGDVMVYAEALAQLEELRGAMAQPALAATGGDLLSRIRRLLGRAIGARDPQCGRSGHRSYFAARRSDFDCGRADAGAEDSRPSP